MKVHLAEYFVRIGYEGPIEPTLTVLRGLHARHPARIPFEALDPFLHRPVSIDGAAIRNKLVHERRGGYCYEQNGLFQDVLATIGFSVTALAARSAWTGPSLNAPKTHRLTLVTLGEERYIADVGFGPQNSPAPLLLVHQVEQPTTHGTYRVMREGLRNEVQLRSEHGWMPLYYFTLTPPLPVDFEVGNWFMSTHPRTLFVRNLIVSRLVGETRVSLLNASLTLRKPDGSFEERALPDARALGEVLENTMELTLPVAAETIWARLPRGFIPAWP